MEKVDLWRLLKMWFEGGFYMDMDSIVNVGGLSKLLQSDVKMVLQSSI